MIRPRCAERGCDGVAVVSIEKPGWGNRGARFYFLCLPCYEVYYNVVKSGIKGITRPEGADEDWRPSISGMIELARFKIADMDRREGRQVAAYQEMTEYQRERSRVRFREVINILKEQRGHSSCPPHSEKP